MANDAYPYWIVAAVRRGGLVSDSSMWTCTRVQAENKHLARAMVERNLPAYAQVVSIAKEVWAVTDTAPAEPQ